MGLTTAQKKRRDAARAALVKTTQENRAKLKTDKAVAAVTDEVKSDAGRASLDTAIQHANGKTQERMERLGSQIAGAFDTVNTMVGAAVKKGETEKAIQQERDRVVKSKISAEKKVIRTEGRLANDARIAASKIEGRKADAHAQRKPILDIRNENRAGCNPRKLSKEQQVVEDECNDALRELNILIQSSNGMHPGTDPLS
jgi:hypothetical protein